MPSIRIDCPGEVPVLEHRQEHTQALLSGFPARVAGTADLVRAQALDLLEDGHTAGLGQDQVLALCLEVLRQLLGPSDQDAWSGSFTGVHLSFGSGRKIRPSEPFRSIDLRGWLESLEDWKLEEAAGQTGSLTQTEQAIGLPDPERLVVGAALCLLEGYVCLSGNSLHATYEVEGIPRWADADQGSLNAGLVA